MKNIFSSNAGDPGNPSRINMASLPGDRFLRNIAPLQEFRPPLIKGNHKG